MKRLEPNEVQQWLGEHNDRNAVVVQIPGSQTLGFLRDPGDLRNIASLSLQYLLAAVGTSFLVVIVASWCLAFPFYRRLKQQEEIIEKIADGDLSVRGGLKSRDALGRLSHRVDAMADRIQGLVVSHQQLFARGFT